MSGCLLRVALDGDVEMLKLIISKLFDDFSEQGDTWMVIWELLKCFELAMPGWVSGRAAGAGGTGTDSS